MSSISRFPNYLYCWIYSSYILHKKLNKILQKPPFVPFWNLKSLIIFYLLSFAFICCATHCYSLSLFVISYHSLSCVVTRSHSLPFVVTYCIICCHSLSFDVPLVVPFVVTYCHSMYHSSVFLQAIEKESCECTENIIFSITMIFFENAAHLYIFMNML